LNLFIERADVNLAGLVRFFFFLFSALLDFRAFLMAAALGA